MIFHECPFDSNFVRYYFVSDSVLLSILSESSGDLEGMQSHYKQLFASIDRVVYSNIGGDIKRQRERQGDREGEGNGSSIVEIQSSVGCEWESVALSEPVLCNSSSQDRGTDDIEEEWLCVLERQMQRSMKKQLQTAALDCLDLFKFTPHLLSQSAVTPALSQPSSLSQYQSQSLRAFVKGTCGQLALLGLQV